MQEVFERSMIDWLPQADLVAIYDRYDDNPLPLSFQRLGPVPHNQGIFLYESERFSDRFHWTNVNQPRRLNCVSGRRFPGNQVTHTHAALQLPNGDSFQRRNHHRGDHPICIVHYLIRPAVGGGGAGVEAADGDANAGGDEAGAEDGDADAGGDEADDGEADDGEADDGEAAADEEDSDPDNDSDVEESQKVVSLCERFKDKVLELEDPVRGGVAPLLSSVSYYEVGNRYNDGKIIELAAIVNRQVSVVRLLLQAGVKTDIMVRLGAWSWDTNTGEEFRVGAGVAEPYPLTWCAVEFFDTSGDVLRLLLKLQSPNATYNGRTLLHHAVLCGNQAAVRVLLSCGADPETTIRTSPSTELRPIHIAARYESVEIIQQLVGFGCDINSKTDAGNTALLISTRHKHSECIKVLALAGAYFGLVNKLGHSVISVAESSKWCLGLERVVLDLIRSGVAPHSSNASVFSPLLYVARVGDAEALKSLVKAQEVFLDYQDEDGFSAAMLAAMKGHVEAFRVLVYAGADVKLFNKSGDTVESLSEKNGNLDMIEKVMLEYALEKDNMNMAGLFYALHCAARRGDVKAVKLLSGKGYSLDVPDGDGYTPLMLAAIEGHGKMCEFLITHGANCYAKNGRGKTLLDLAVGDTEEVIRDELSRRFVLKGSSVMKHTKGGKGKKHGKRLVMLETSGVLSWGKSRKRNVVCKEVEVGMSQRFRKNRKGKGDAAVEEEGIFRVVTKEDKEVHFVCEGGLVGAEMW